MQDMRPTKETLGERATSDQGVIAKCVCSRCGSQTFAVYILEGYHMQPRCEECDEIWETVSAGQEQDTGVSKTVGNGGDESGDLVSPQIFKALTTIPCQVCEANRNAKAKAQRNWRARKSGRKT